MGNTVSNDVTTRPTAEDVADGLHVVLGTGQVGRTLASVLRRRGADVRVVDRSGTVPPGVDDDVEAVAADISEPREAHRACEGASIVYFCLQPPYDRWPELFPPLVDGAVEGAAEADATFVMADNLYMYGPAPEPLHEELPTAATTEKGKTRAEIADRILESHENGRIRATIGRASDFYGPDVTESIVGRRFFPRILDGKGVWYPGAPDAQHTYTYIRDFARALAVLGSSDAAPGEVWHVPSAETMTTREFARLAADIADTDPSVRRVPSFALTILGAVSPTIGQINEIRYQFTDDFVVSDAKFRSTFDFAPTPHRDAIRQTLEWYETDFDR